MIERKCVYTTIYERKYQLRFSGGVCLPLSSSSCVVAPSYCLLDRENRIAIRNRSKRFVRQTLLANGCGSETGRRRAGGRAGVVGWGLIVRESEWRKSNQWIAEALVYFHTKFNLIVNVCALSRHCQQYTNKRVMRRQWQQHTQWQNENLSIRKIQI